MHVKLHYPCMLVSIRINESCITKRSISTLAWSENVVECNALQLFTQGVSVNSLPMNQSAMNNCWSEAKLGRLCLQIEVKVSAVTLILTLHGE